MARETIDWAAQLQPTPQGAEFRGDTMADFVERATAELAPLHIGDDVVEAVEAAGCRVSGNRYFSVLFSDDDTVAVEDRVRSAFTGSVAHGRTDVAGEAYAHLVAGSDVESVNADLLARVNKALRTERRHGTYERIERLDGAAKALGKPAYRRFLGGFATELVMRGRY